MKCCRLIEVDTFTSRMGHVSLEREWILQGYPFVESMKNNRADF